MEHLANLHQATLCCYSWTCKAGEESQRSRPPQIAAEHRPFAFPLANLQRMNSTEILFARFVFGEDRESRSRWSHWEVSPSLALQAPNQSSGDGGLTPNLFANGASASNMPG